MAETYIGTRQMAPVHPGAILREDVIPSLGITVAAAADELGLSRQTLHRILSEKAPITTETALRLGQWCGNGAELWLRMQATYDLYHTARRIADALSAIPSRLAA
jgi:addiction module HigA family antidote